MKASFVKFTSTGKTAICMVKTNAFALGAGTPVYMNADAVRDTLGENPDKGSRFDLPEESKLIDLTWIDQETKEPVIATTDDGVVLQTIA